MNKIVLLLATFWLVVGLSANILSPRYIARVWFDDQNDCHVLFGDEAWWEDFSVNDVCFTTSSGSYYLPPYYFQPQEPVFSINLSEEIPDFTIQRDQDFLRVSMPGHYFPEELRWGLQNDASINIHPLGLGQSAVQIYAPIYTTHGEYDSAHAWAKDNQINGPNIYQPTSRCTLNVHLQDPSGTPAPGITVYSSFFGYAEVYDQYYHDPTDSSGDWIRSQVSIRRSILVKDPQTGYAVLQEVLFPEPDETIHRTGTISSVSSQDPVQPAAVGDLCLSPSILSLSSRATVDLRYESTEPLSQAAVLSIYDLRGRFMSEKEMPSFGVTSWDLSDLKSGIYFIVLKEGGRFITKSRLTVFR